MKFVVVTFTLLCSVLSFAQATAEWRSWNQPVTPFRIVGNIYYVGANEIASYLITTPKGHVLLDGGFAETAPQIRDNIRKLGFKITDVKYLLNSQAHFDHAAGLAQLKRWSGAQFLVSEGDSQQIARGGKGDFAWGDKFQYEPLKADRLIMDGERLELGGTVLTAHLTPGHTKGCTTWTTQVHDGGRVLNVVFVCSTTAPGYKLVNNEKYPDIVQDFQKSFQRWKKMPCDVLLASHGSFFGIEEKRAAMKYSGSNPFVDPAECRTFFERSESAFNSELKKQQH